MKILIATDGSDYSKAAIDALANVVAKPKMTTFKVISSVEFPTVPPTDGFIVASADYYDDFEKAGHEQAKKAVEHAETQIRRLFPDETLDISAEVLIGSPQRVLVEKAAEWNADLIVVGSHGYGFWSRALLGSVSNSVVQHSPCSVLVVRTTSEKK